MGSDVSLPRARPRWSLLSLYRTGLWRLSPVLMVTSGSQPLLASSDASPSTLRISSSSLDLPVVAVFILLTILLPGQMAISGTPGVLRSCASLLALGLLRVLLLLFPFLLLVLRIR